MTEDELLGVAERFGTPTFAFDTVAFGRRVALVGQAFGSEVGLCYSIKANPFLVPAARDAGMRLEVCSPGELSICEALGVPGETIVYSGVCKREDDVHEALSYGVGTFTAESLGQLALVDRVARSCGARVPVLLRLNAGSQFGMSRADLVRAVDGSDSLPGVELVGIHYFAGTQRRRLDHQRRDLAMLQDLADELVREHGWRPSRLEYGPGLAVPYFEGDDFSNTLAPARELADALRHAASRLDLTVEMGRFLASECGSYVTQVVDLKDADDQTSYALVDGGINHVVYLGQLMGLKVPVVRNLSLGDGRARREREWTVCGSLCTTGDVLVRKLRTPLAEGDLLAFDNLGAYSVTEGIALFLSRELPLVALRGEDGWRVARKRVGTSALNLPLATPGMGT